MSMRSVEYENRQILALLQAMWGAISANILGVSIECEGEDVHLHFVLKTESQEDREEIEDIVSELEALQSGPFPIYAHITVLAGPWLGVGSVAGRPVYVRKTE